ncbi:MAG: right-handed parallel beta-helix repeat-containing protein [Oscillospiraceae bacterium]|nr:right-handed parallel beta-helix repeat-containing protein [Oscillospiraceae bacterium]
MIGRKIRQKLSAVFLCSFFITSWYGSLFSVFADEAVGETSGETSGVSTAVPVEAEDENTDTSSAATTTAPEETEEEAPDISSDVTTAPEEAEEETTEVSADVTTTSPVEEEEENASIALLDAIVAAIGENPYPTLQDAVNDAADGQTIKLLSDTTENITSSSKSYTLEMNGHTINGGQNGCVYIINGGTVTLRGGTLTNGKNTAWGASGSGGGLRITNATVTLENMTISNNTAASGGGIYIQNGEVTIGGSTISGNTTTTGTGGGINFSGGSLTIDNSTISGNTAGSNGGGIYFNSGAFTLRSSTVSDNSASNLGGGVYAGNAADLNNIRFTGNSAKRGGSALYLSTSNKVTVSDCEFTGNYGDGSTIGSSVITADEVMGYGAEFIFERCNISCNSAVEYTFYVECENYYWYDTPINLTLNDCEISDNEAIRSGGIYIYDLAIVSLNNTVVKNNKATGTPGANTPVSGGVVCHNSADVTFNLVSGAVYNNTCVNGDANDLFIGQYATVNVITADKMKDTARAADYFSSFVWSHSDGTFIDEDMSGRYAKDKGYAGGLSLTAFDTDIIPAAVYKGVKYDTISDAIAAAKQDNANPAKIQLLPGVDKSGEEEKYIRAFYSDKLTIDINVILDLNLCALNARESILFEVTDNASLTLSGTGVVKGSIDVDDGSTLILATDIDTDLSIKLGGANASLKLSDDFVRCGTISIELDDTRANALNNVNKTDDDISYVIVANGKGKIDPDNVKITNLKNTLVDIIADGSDIVAVNPTLKGSLFVSSGGDDNNDGTPADPLHTIEQAIENAESGGTIYILDTITVENSAEWDGKDKNITITRYIDEDNPDVGGANMVTINSGSSLELRNITIDGNSKKCTNAGSIINVSQNGTLTIGEGTVLQNNDVSKTNVVARSADSVVKARSGGAVYTVGGQITIKKNSTIQNCVALLGGGIYCEKGTIDMYGGKFTGNEAIGPYTVSKNENYYGCGGGIVVTGSGVMMTMTGGEFIGNKATYGGGVCIGTGIYSLTSNSAEAFRMDEGNEGGGAFTDNYASSNGGGLFVQSSYKAVINAGDFTGNKCGDNHFGGGAIYVNGGKNDVIDGELWVTKVLITGNTAKEYGGGIAGCNTSGTIINMVDGSVIYGNTTNNGPCDISTATDPFQPGKFNGSKITQTQDHFTQFMLDETPYHWKSAIDGNGFKTGDYVSEDYLNSRTGKAVYTDEKPQPDTESSKIKVRITNNHADEGSGGGIGSNGSVFIGGGTYVANWNYKQPIEFEVEKVWKDTNGTICNYPAALDQLNIWILGIDSSGNVHKKVHNPMMINGVWQGKVGFEPFEDNCTTVLLEEVIYADGKHVWSADGRKYESVVRDIMDTMVSPGAPIIWSDDANSPFTSELAKTTGGNFAFTNSMLVYSPSAPAPAPGDGDTENPSGPSASEPSAPSNPSAPTDPSDPSFPPPNGPTGGFAFIVGSPDKGEEDISAGSGMNGESEISSSVVITITVVSAALIAAGMVIGNNMLRRKKK